MTREEAIKILTEIRDEAGESESAVCYVASEEDVEALDMAIEALSQESSEDVISRQAAIDALKHNQDVYSHNFHDDPIDKYTTAIIATDIDTLVKLPSAQPEPLTDKEQKIFLTAMGREEKVCKQVDEEFKNCREPYEDSLVRVCHEITRKVKGALWT